jgi:tetratricopeptide (TPR) repeat protein
VFVTRLGVRFWTVPLALLWLGTAEALGPLRSVALAQQPAGSENKSWMDSMTSGIKKGFSKVGSALNPSSKPTATPAPEDDAVSLKVRGKPGPALYVAVARRYEQLGQSAESEQQYLLALKEKADYLPALLGYAQLKEHLGQPDDAIRLYQRAVKAYPREASVHNNLGLYYARLGRRDEAIIVMSRAVELAPKNPLYRNNMATMLVDQGRLREAFAHLEAAHGEAAAYYNLGYLLNKKGQTQAAMQHFSLALKADPSMVPAQRWLEYLQRSTAQVRVAQRPAADGLRSAGERPREEPSAPPNEPMPSRLPPTASSEPASDAPTLPGILYDRSGVPAAPMPPPSGNSAVQPLPRAN